jgi:hypothetical protein
MMSVQISRACLLAVALLLSACATGEGAKRPAHTVEAVGKVIASLAGEAARRAATDGYRGLPVVVGVASHAPTSLEQIIAELLRTQLLEKGVLVHKSCAGRCLEMTLQEFATVGPSVSDLTPGQILSVAAGSVRVVGGLTRSLVEREREAERAAARTTGLLVTFAARDGERFTARSHVIAIVSTSSGDIALEQK